MLEFATQLIWENQAFPEPRLATAVAERPITIIEKLRCTGKGEDFPKIPSIPTIVPEG
jgi:hypothetical protein